ncbi:TPA: glutathione S-transferase C-terminal domain-containing protein [Yersinia enterocolitica]
MKDNEYQPPKVWTENNASGGVWSKINRPTAGARYEADLPVGKHPLQLYSMGTPNGQKVTILLEELLALGEKGAAPYLGGGFGHFYHYAPVKIEYAIDRFTMEAKRQLDLLNTQLATHEYIAGDEYSIADIAIWPWYGNLVLGLQYEAGEFLDVKSYTHLIRWTETIGKRPAVQRGRIVNKTWGTPEEQLAERHDASDFDRLIK